MSLKARRKRITAIKSAKTDQITMPGSVEEQLQSPLAEQLSFPHPAITPINTEQETSQASAHLPAVTPIDTEQKASRRSRTQPATTSTNITRKIPLISLESSPTLVPDTSATFIPTITEPHTGQVPTLQPVQKNQQTDAIERLTTPKAQQTGTLSALAIRQQVTGTLSAADVISQQTGSLVVTNDVHRQLLELQNSGMLPVIPTERLLNDTTGRLPIVIPGSARKSTGMLLAPRPRAKRPLVHTAVALLLLFLLTGTLLAVIPVGAKGQTGLSLFHSVANMIQSKNSNTALIAAQVATATAVTQDGFDQGNRTYAGVASAPTTNQAVPAYKPPVPAYKPAVTVPNGIVSSGSSSASDAGSLSRFTYGQCTYWANMRYHALTGHWPSWLGNAYQWSYGATAAGWVVSNTPNPHGPSIIVLQPYVQGAGAYGHVAVVETGAGAGSVSATNWNWAGHWGSTTWVTFTSPAAGTKFVWYPGA